jgi:NitT/TauT family transport system substrate-binding protein
MAGLASVPVLRRGKAAGLRKIKVATTPLPESCGLYVALERGYFRDSGLDVELVTVPGTIQVNTAMISGQVEVMMGGLAPMILNAVAQGSGVRIVAPRQLVSAKCGNVGTLFALKKKFPGGLKDMTVLKGKSIGVGSVVGFTEFAVDMQLENAGLADHAAEYVHLPVGQGAAALLNGRVDALAVLPETARALMEKPDEIVMSPPLASICPGFQYSFVYFGSVLLKDDRDAGGRFLSAFMHGSRDYHAGSNPQFLRDFAARSGHDPKEYLSSCRDDVSVETHVDRANLQRFAQWAVRRRYAQRLVDVSELVDEGFAAKA